MSAKARRTFSGGSGRRSITLQWSTPWLWALRCQRSFESDPMAEATFWQPQRQALAAYDEALDRFKLDGFVYPAVQMPPNDELLPLLEGRRSNGPHSQTAWVNAIGV